MARNFNGTSDFISAADSASLDISTNITLSCWVYGGSGTGITGGFQHFIVKPAQATWNTNPHAVYYLRAHSGNAEFGVIDDFKVIAGSTAFANGVWTHVAGSYDSSNVRVFFNGAQDGILAVTASMTTSTQPLNIGFSESPDNGYMNGRIADAAIWNVALTAAEILTLAKGARPNTIRPTALAAWWPLAGLQSPEPDLSGNKNNGTLTGTANASGPPVMQFTPRWPQRAAETTLTTIFLPGQFSTSFAQRVSAVGY